MLCVRKTTGLKVGIVLSGQIHGLVVGEEDMESGLLGSHLKNCGAQVTAGAERQDTWIRPTLLLSWRGGLSAFVPCRHRHYTSSSTTDTRAKDTCAVVGSFCLGGEVCLCPFQLAGSQKLLVALSKQGELLCLCGLETCEHS